MNALADVSDF